MALRTGIPGWQRDWHDVFAEWAQDVDLDPRILEGYTFQAQFLPVEPEIPFGHYAGQRRWATVADVPHIVRDQLVDLIVVQGDTEFASVEQQRALYLCPPSDADRDALIRVNREEIRHGFQMLTLLDEHFGESGRKAIQGLLERRAGQVGKRRLLGAFNEPVLDWLDMYCYLEYIDRDGKWQLMCLSHSGFAPLAASTRYMLREESFHIGTGRNGIMRIVKAGVVPIPVLQRYINLWASVGYDLFGKDRSGSSVWAYERSLKGRPMEVEDLRSGRKLLDREEFNAIVRGYYRDDIAAQIDRLNKYIPEGQPRLVTPSDRFHRAIGPYQGQCWSVEGEEVAPDEYPTYLENALPTAEDRALIAHLQEHEKDHWVQPRAA